MYTILVVLDEERIARNRNTFDNLTKNYKADGVTFAALNSKQALAYPQISGEGEASVDLWMYEYGKIYNHLKSGNFNVSSVDMNNGFFTPMIFEGGRVISGIGVILEN